MEESEESFKKGVDYKNVSVKWGFFFICYKLCNINKENEKKVVNYIFKGISG